jgi:hypothetical protein
MIFGTEDEAMAVTVPHDWPACLKNEKGAALLREAYGYDRPRGLFVRHAAPRKVFSVEWLEDHSISDPKQALLSRRGDPEFYWTGTQPVGIEPQLAKA